MGVVGGAAGERADEGGDALRVGSEDGKLRHWLAGRLVRHWDLLEVRLADGNWLQGRYEWTGRPDDDPALIVELGGHGEAWRREAQFLLPIGAELRWAELQPEAAVGGGHGDVTSRLAARDAAPAMEMAAPARSTRRKGGTTGRPRKVIDVRDEAEGAEDEGAETSPPLF